MRRLLPLITLLCLAVLVAPSLAGAAKSKKRGEERRGGNVTKAWPRDKGDTAPDHPLAEWLAKQVGPVPVKEKKRKRGRRGADRLVAHAAAWGGTTSSSAVSFGALASGSLLLVRSFDIPTSDADYGRLANLSWTYDNALAALAFIDHGYRSQAEQVLDQLKALQLKDGSLAFAYDVKTGAASGQIRSNALAWAGIAAVAYREQYRSTRYDAMVAGLADYLLKSRRSDGLVLGGPDVQWVSTQHNLLMAEFFRAAYAQYGSRTISGAITGAQLNTAYNAAATSIVGKLLVQSGATTYFVQGLNDARIPLDVQTLGSVFLSNRNDGRATQVANWFNANLYIAPRVVGGVTWSGYKPFASSIAPNVVWSEGTIQGDWALHRLDVDSSLADIATLGIYETTKGGTTGPKGAERTVDDRAWGEFPSWPTSAAGSWLLILAGGGDVLFTRS